MKLSNGLKIIGIAMFCFVLFTLQGKLAFASQSGPNPYIVRRLAAIAPNHIYLSHMRIDALYDELIAKLIMLSRQVIEETEGFYERPPYFVYLKRVRDELSPEFIDIVDEIIISARQRAESARARREAAIELTINSFVLAEDFGR